MPRFCFDFATPDDSRELLEILEKAAFRGQISLLYTRRPDAFHSLRMEGDRVEIVVCRDAERGKIAGFGACATRRVFLNGQPETVGYLFGLRVRREYAKKFPLLHRGYAFLHDSFTLRSRFDANGGELPSWEGLRVGSRPSGCRRVNYPPLAPPRRGVAETLRSISDLSRQAPPRLYLTTILEDNHAAQTLLEKPRDFMPTYAPYGGYQVYAFACSNKLLFRRKRGELRQARPDDADALSEFLSEQGRRFQGFPVVAPEMFRARVPGWPALEDFYLLKNARGDILACGAFWDQTAYKQYIAQGYGGAFKLLAPLSRCLPLFGIPALPKAGECLRFFTLSFWAVKDDDPAIFQAFLDGIPSAAATFPLYVVGAHETHPLCPMLQYRPHIGYKSRVYAVNWHDLPPFDMDPALPFYLECGML